MKVTLEAALGLIGGTMGLFTGFSVLSGIETIFFLAKFVLKMRIPRVLARQSTFQFFPLRYCGSQNVLRSDSSYSSQMQGIVELSAKAIFSKKTLLYSAGSECEKE